MQILNESVLSRLDVLEEWCRSPEMAYALVLLQVAVVEVLPHPADVAPVEVPVSVILHLLPAASAKHVEYGVVQGRLVADNPLAGLAFGRFTRGAALFGSVHCNEGTMATVTHVSRQGTSSLYIAHPPAHTEMWESQNHQSYS